MFFSTLVLGSLNGVMSPIVQGSHAMLENQLLDMNDLQQKKDLLEREAMLRNPEMVYLISNEEFDKNWRNLDGRHLTWSRCQECISKERCLRLRKISEMVFVSFRNSFSGSSIGH